jgi:DNA-binding transcriptional ArsR family regulator
MNDETIMNERERAAAESSDPVEAAPTVADELVITDLEVVRVISDRLRLRVIEAFGRHRGIPRTVKEVARELGEPPTKLYYHVNLLEQHGLLIVAESNLVSGIVEKRYLPAAKSIRVDRRLMAEYQPDAPGAKDSPVGTMVESIVEGTADDFRRALAAGLLEARDGGPDQKRTVISRGSIRLSEKGAKALVKALRAILATDDEEGATDTYALTVAFFRESSDQEDPS